MENLENLENMENLDKIWIKFGKVTEVIESCWLFYPILKFSFQFFSHFFHIFSTFFPPFSFFHLFPSLLPFPKNTKLYSVWISSRSKVQVKCTQKE